MEKDQLDIITNEKIPETIRSLIAEKFLTSDDRELARSIELKRLSSEQHSARWNTPIAAALAGLITLYSTNLFDRWSANNQSQNAATLAELEHSLKESEVRLLQQLESETAHSAAGLAAAASERQFQYELVKAELSDTSREAIDRARALLFLARAGILNSLNTDELRQMAEDQIERPEEKILPTQFGIGREEVGRMMSNLFDPGSTISYSFFEEPPAGARAAIEAAMREWERYANIRFVYYDDTPNTVARISFDGTSRDSAFLGTNALLAPRHLATLTFASDLSADDGWLIALSELGHLLGLPNETANPRGGPSWNEELALAFFQNEFGMDAAETGRRFFTKSKNYPCDRYFDPTSIMMPILPQQLFATSLPELRLSGLSESDKRCISQMYPFSAAATQP